MAIEIAEDNNVIGVDPDCKVNAHLKLQSDLFLKYRELGASYNLASLLSQESIHIIFTSDVVSPDTKLWYENLPQTKGDTQ